MEHRRPKTTTEGMNCSFRLYSIIQNRARPSLHRLSETETGLDAEMMLQVNDCVKYALSN